MCSPHTSEFSPQTLGCHGLGYRNVCTYSLATEHTDTILQIRGKTDLPLIAVLFFFSDRPITSRTICGRQTHDLHSRVCTGCVSWGICTQSFDFCLNKYSKGTVYICLIEYKLLFVTLGFTDCLAALRHLITWSTASVYNWVRATHVTKIPITVLNFAKHSNNFLISNFDDTALHCSLISALKT